MKLNIFKSALFAIALPSVMLTSCHRNDDEVDDLPQEDISNVLLSVKDNADGTVKSYNYQINGSSIPEIKLTNGHTYSVTTVFKNGAEDATQEIRDAKDKHFVVFDFPNSDIDLTRADDASSTRADGKKVGLNSVWKVNTAANNGNAKLILTLYHESATVSEQVSASGTGKVYGTQTGGETDAHAEYKISNN